MSNMIVGVADVGIVVVVVVVDNGAVGIIVAV